MSEEISVFIFNGVIEKVVKSNPDTVVRIIDHDDMRTREEVEELKKQGKVITSERDDYVVTEF